MLKIGSADSTEWEFSCDGIKWFRIGWFGAIQTSCAFERRMAGAAPLMQISLLLKTFPSVDVLCCSTSKALFLGKEYLASEKGLCMSPCPAFCMGALSCELCIDETGTFFLFGWLVLGQAYFYHVTHIQLDFLGASSNCTW